MHCMLGSAELGGGAVAVVVGEALEVGHLLLPRVQRRLHHRVHGRLRRELPEEGIRDGGDESVNGAVVVHTLEKAGS